MNREIVAETRNAREAVVMGAPRLPLQDRPAGAILGECRTCNGDLMFSAECPTDLPRMCVGCIAKVAIEKPFMTVILPSGRRFVSAYLLGVTS